MARCILKLKDKHKTTFLSPSENWCLPASTLKLEEREFVVDSRASIHMIIKKDLSDAEMDTLTKSCSPTIVITANGEVQTHEEAIVYVKELDIFLTMKVLENTPAVLSLGKLARPQEVAIIFVESAAARVCRVGARVSTNVFLLDFDLRIARHDAGRLEVVADGLPIFGGAQFVVDTTLVSPVQENGHPHRHCAEEDGAASRPASGNN